MKIDSIIMSCTLRDKRNYGWIMNKTKKQKNKFVIGEIKWGNYMLIDTFYFNFEQRKNRKKSIIDLNLIQINKESYSYIPLN